MAKNNKSNPTASDPQDKTQKRKVGRPNQGLTDFINDNRRDTKRIIRNLSQPDNFRENIIERVQGEIIDDNELSQFEECYRLTCETIINDFRENNPELIKKHPYNYYKRILIRIKKAVPPVSYKDIDKLIIIWDILKEWLNDIGLYITYETFEQLTNVYKYQLKKGEELSPKYGDFVEKINKDCDTALINELSFNPYNQTNKIFLAKVHGIVEKTEPKQIEVTHKIRNYDELPMNNIDFGKIE